MEVKKQKFKQNYKEFTIYFIFYEQSNAILEKYKDDDLHELSSEEKETINKIKELIKFLNDIKIKEIYDNLKELKFEDEYKKLAKNKRKNNVTEKRDNNVKLKRNDNDNDKDEINIIESGSIKDLLENRIKEIEEIEQLKLLLLEQKANLIDVVKIIKNEQSIPLEYTPYEPVKIIECNEEKPKSLFKEFKYNKEFERKPEKFKKKNILFFIIAIVVIIGLIWKILL